MSLDEFVEDQTLEEAEQEAESLMRGYNESYRAGNPTISDAEYDFKMKLFADIYPNNEYLNQKIVEPEPELGGKTVKLPRKMLSTNKAYSHKEIEKFLNDCTEVGRRLGVKNIQFRITPKMDGFAGFREDSKLFTRGNGTEGGDISHALANGLQSPQFEWAIDSNGPGEIVCDKAYFAEHLADSYENTRNIIAGAIKSGELDPKIKEAIRLGKIVFYPFNNLGGWLLPKEKVLENLEEIWDEVVANCLYNTDGLVLECNNEKIKVEMGCTSHHWKWMLAYKKNEEFHEVKVTDIEWNTARVGRITPVILLEPTEVLGVTVSRCSGHNAGLLMKQGINAGAIVNLTRSGAVIPHVVSVIKRSDIISMPEKCPSCGSPTELVEDHLMCNNKECFAQVEGVVEHFFKEMGILGFGPVIVKQLCDWGYDNIADIYDMHQQDLYNVIGGKNAENLYNAIQSSKKKEVEDWRLLGSFALDGIGGSMCEKLLQVYPLETIFELTEEEVQKIPGFGFINSVNLINSLKRIRDDFEYLLPMFNVKKTVIGGIKMNNEVSGKVFVITGTLLSGKREELHTKLKELGGIVGTSVSAKTQYLVTGLNVGAAKTSAAVKHGVKVISEDEFLEMLK